jgi:regulator of sigma E protease
MNFLLAVAIISYLFSAKGVALPTEHVNIVEVAQGSPAQAAGLMKGDEVLLLNDKEVSNTKDFIEATRQSTGRAILLKIKRGDQEFLVNVTPRETYPEGQGPLGVAISNIEVRKYPWYQAPFYGTLEAFKFSWMILSGLGQMVYDGILKGQKPTDVAGPIGVAQLTGQAVSYGFEATLWFVALLSLNLAVVNVLPIPALDGGRLFFIAIEFITRRKVSPKYEAMAHAIGLALLLGLILVITLFDILRVASGQSLLPEM